MMWKYTYIVLKTWKYVIMRLLLRAYVPHCGYISIGSDCMRIHHGSTVNGNISINYPQTVHSIIQEVQGSIDPVNKRWTAVAGQTHLKDIDDRSIQSITGGPPLCVLDF